MEHRPVFMARADIALKQSLAGDLAYAPDEPPQVLPEFQPPMPQAGTTVPPTAAMGEKKSCPATATSPVRYLAA